MPSLAEADVVTARTAATAAMAMNKERFMIFSRSPDGD
jgi:hypothetical protein